MAYTGSNDAKPCWLEKTFRICAFLRACCLVALLVVSAGFSAMVRAQSAIEPLQLGHALEAKLTGGEAREYSIAVSESQFLCVTIEPKLFNSVIRMTLFDPAGNQVAETVGLVPAVPMYLIAKSAGTFRLEIALPPGADAETYSLVLNELHDATDQDRTRAAAGNTFMEAYRKDNNRREKLPDAVAQRYAEALSLFREAVDEESQAAVLFFLSWRFFRAKEFRSCADYARRAQELWASLNQDANQLGPLDRLRVCALSLGLTDEALDAINKSLVLLRSSGDVAGEARALSDRGDVYGMQGELQDALTDKQQALSLLRQTGSQPDEYMILLEIGGIEGDIGETDQAIYFTEQALNLVRSRNDREAEPGVLAAVANLYAGEGDLQTALRYYQNAVQASQGDAFCEAWTKLRLADFYSVQQEYEKALQLYTSVLPYFHQNHRPAFEAGTLLGMALVLHKQGKLDEALADLQQALALKRPFPGPSSDILRELGAVYQDKGDNAKALEFYRQVLNDSRAKKSLMSESMDLYGIAQAEHALHQDRDARRDIEAALGIFESVRAGFLAPERRSSFFAQGQDGYEFYIRLLMDMHAQQPHAGFDAAAFQASERARARSLLDMLLEAHADIHEGVDPALLRRARLVEQRLRRRSQYQFELLSGNHTAEQAESVAHELQNLNADYEEIEGQIRASSPRFASLQYPEPLSLKKVQESVLDSDTLLLEYSLGDDRSYVWAVSPDGLASFVLPPRTQIEAAARAVYTLLTARNQHPRHERELHREARLARARAEYPAAASRLSTMILGPVQSLLAGKRRVVVVADGVLQYIPFAALPVPAAHKTSRKAAVPLVVKSEVVTAPSASTIAVLRRELAGRRPAPKMVAVIADPIYDRSDPRISAAGDPVQTSYNGAAASAGERHVTFALERSWDDVTSGNENGWKMSRLPFSRREAAAIIAAAPPGSSFEALDFRADRDTATSPQLAQYRFIHFATHGMLDSHTPALSGLVFSLVDEKGRPKDGFLRLWDIYNLHLPAELVVLSSCQTGLGKEIAGEGLVGLTRGFFYAGAARVIASLWKVDDLATAELMARLYDGMLHKGLSPAAALRSAQIAVWKQKRWEGDPYFWAAFEIQGEWN